MRIRRTDLGAFTRYNVSALETERWATKPGARWPGSTLSGKAGWVELDNKNGDLVDISDSWRDADAHELRALIEDFPLPSP